eukprot:6458327-Amphidinium_carterae.1
MRWRWEAMLSAAALGAHPTLHVIQAEWTYGRNGLKVLMEIKQYQQHHPAHGAHSVVAFGGRCSSTSSMEMKLTCAASLPPQQTPKDSKSFGEKGHSLMASKTTSTFALARDGSFMK